jgi:hypothetical protein
MAVSGNRLSRFVNFFEEKKTGWLVSCLQVMLFHENKLDKLAKF